MFIRYSLTGAIATAVHYVVLLCLVEALGIKPWIATAIGALCGAGVAYMGNRHFTFSHSLLSTSNRKALPRFLIIAALGAGLNSLILGSITTLFNWHYFAAQVIATIIVLILTYHLNRTWTFA